MPPFIVLSLGRSRSTWLSRFLTYGDWHCGHDEILHLRSLEDVQSWFAQPETGTAETAAAHWWRLLLKVRPDIKIVVVRRPVEEVVASYMKSGGYDREALTATLRRADRKLDQIEHRIPGVLSVSYSDLENEATCARIFEHCLPYPHDHSWWMYMAKRNVQVDLRAVTRYYHAHKPQLDRLQAQAKAQSIFDLSQQPVNVTDVSIREESLWDYPELSPDSQSSVWQHAITVGEHPNSVLDKNWDLMRDLERRGCLQVLIARFEKQIVGYIFTVISPSLEAPGKLVATDTTLFASPKFPRLGLKLVHEAHTRLPAKGVFEVSCRAGVRGDGPRLAAVYRRMGGEYDGQIFKMNLQKD